MCNFFCLLFINAHVISLWFLFRKQFNCGCYFRFFKNRRKKMAIVHEIFQFINIKQVFVLNLISCTDRQAQIRIFNVIRSVMCTCFRLN